MPEFEWRHSEDRASSPARRGIRRVILPPAGPCTDHLPPTRSPYAPSPLRSATDAHTARSFAHARKSWISSARVVESGTVPAKASSSPWVDTSCFCANAAYIDVCTADSISAPEKPRAAADTRSRSNSSGLRFRLLQLNRENLFSFRLAWKVHEKQFVEASLANQFWRQHRHVVTRRRNKHRRLSILHP